VYPALRGIGKRMESPTGIIPEDLMYRAQRTAVVDWLVKQPLPGHLKRNLLAGWAVLVGVKISGRELRKVEASGADF
jgi:hypothetical protein